MIWKLKAILWSNEVSRYLSYKMSFRRISFYIAQNFRSHRGAIIGKNDWRLRVYLVLHSFPLSYILNRAMSFYFNQIFWFRVILTTGSICVTLANMRLLLPDTIPDSRYGEGQWVLACFEGSCPSSPATLRRFFNLIMLWYEMIFLVAGLCIGNLAVTGEFPSKSGSDTELSCFHYC